MINQISIRLKNNASNILKIWEKKAVRQVLAARNQSSLALRDSLPEYINQLVNSLSTTIERTQKKMKTDKDDSTRVGKIHGYERAGFLGYSMDQIILEFHLLRQSIFEALEKDGPVGSRERDVIIDSIEQAVNDSATQFSDTLSDIQELFMLTLTHDLRAPITTAKMNAEITLKHPQNFEFNSKAANRIIDSMDRADSMISDLLDSSRVRAGLSLSLEFKEEVDLDALLRDVVNDMSHTHDSKFVLESSSPVIGHFSPKGLRRVFENLLTNAVKYGDSATPITISIKADTFRVVISFHNVGRLINESDQASLFQRFKRSEESRDKKGWGIGLVLVKGIVEAHRGRIKVKSTAHEGTTFIVELPLSKVN